MCKSEFKKLFQFISSRLLSKNLNMKLYEIVILPIVLNGRETG